MPIFRATAVLNKVSGIPKDAARNVWHFNSSSDTTAAMQQIADGVELFYKSMQTRLGAQVSAAPLAHRVEIARVTPGGPGEDDDSVTSLLLTKAFTLAPASTSIAVMPNEVAIAMSFSAGADEVPEEVGFTRPRSRRRGRIYLGPVASSCFGFTTTTNEPFITTTTRETILDAYDLGHGVWGGAVPGIAHVVYSRTDGIARTVDRVSLDSEPDVVRRRGRKPSLRLSRVVVAAAPSAPRDSTDVALAS